MHPGVPLDAVKLEAVAHLSAKAEDRDVRIGERLLLSVLRVQPLDPVKIVAAQIQMVPKGVRPWNGKGVGVIKILHQAGSAGGS